uniref:Uncharacterized protein n=1 Tax=Theropithecus gelada TaxID=9565 RepID=A0A8D2FCA0_THEGE
MLMNELARNPLSCLAPPCPLSPVLLSLRGLLSWETRASSSPEAIEQRPGLAPGSGKALVGTARAGRWVPALAAAACVAAQGVYRRVSYPPSAQQPVHQSVSFSWKGPRGLPGAAMAQLVSRRSALGAWCASFGKTPFLGLPAPPALPQDSLLHLPISSLASPQLSPSQALWSLPFFLSWIFSFVFVLSLSLLLLLLLLLFAIVKKIRNSLPVASMRVEPRASQPRLD